MASKRTTTESRGLHRARVGCALAVLVVAGAAPAYAHGPEQRATREIVRLQGYRKDPPAETAGGQAVLISARGVEHRFWATEWRRFVLSEVRSGEETMPARLVLQGDFEVLSRFTKARPDQLITILGERRPGSSDLFILSLDRCPP